MRIKEVTIYGFGRWIDQTFSFSNSNLITLLGDNESGKTTLHQFILYMFFGLTRKKAEIFRPKTSSKLGGRMVIDHPVKGTIVIERLDDSEAQYFDKNGIEKDETWFRQILGNLNRETFESIYSFSNQDLSVLQDMKESNLSELLLSVGLTGSTAIYKVEKKLQTELQKQFKPSGTKPIINEKLNKLHEKNQQVNESKQLEKSYKEQVDKIYTLERNHEHKKEQIAKTNEQLEKERLKEKISPIQKELAQISNELHELADVRDFPLEKQEQLKSIGISINNIDREISSNQTTLDAYTNKKQNLEAASLDDTENEQLNNLLNQKAEIALMRERQKTLEQDYSFRAREITEMIQEKQVYITADELEQIELPFYLEKEWSTLRKEYENLQEKVEKSLQKQETLLREKSQIQEEQQHIKKELLAEAHIDELNKRVNAFNHIGNQGQQQNYLFDMTGQMINYKTKQRRIIVIIGLFIAISAALIAFLTEQSGVYFLSALTLGAVYYFQHMQKREISNLKRQREAWQTNPSLQTNERDVTESEYEEAQQILETQRTLRERLDTLNHTLQQSVRKLEENETIQFDLEQQQNKIEEAIANQRNQFSFLQSVSVLYWQDMYHLMQKMMQLSNEKQSLKKELERTASRIEEFSDQVMDWLEQRGWSNKNSLEEMILALEDLERQEQQYRHEFQQLVQFIKDTMNKQSALKQKRDCYNAEREAILEEAGVTSEKGYFEQFTKKERYNKLYERREELTERLSILLPEKWQHELVNETLETETSYRRQKELELAQADYEEDLEQLKSQLAEQRLRLEQLESEEAISLQKHQLAMEKEELEDLVSNWAVQKTALKMLEYAKKQYKEKHLALVIETAQIYFKEITANQYDTIYSPAAESGFQVENKEKKQRFHVEELSQGTKDQLYISLRFAINEVMAKTSGLPFLMDDAFAHFDMKRTGKIQQVLQRLAEKQQVILFTCRQESAEAANGEIINLSK